MKKIQESKSFSFPTIHINRDDIESILEILRSKGAEINLACKGYEFESLDELYEKYGNSIKIFSITARNPYVSLSFKNNMMKIWLYTSGDDSSGNAAFYEIKELLLKRKSILAKLFPVHIFFIANVTLMSLIFIPKSVINAVFPSNYMLIGIIVLLIVLGLIPLAFSFGHFYTISLLRKHENRSFWYRKRDEIVLVIFGAIFGAVAAILLGKLF